MSPTFVKANVQFVNEPDEMAHVYGNELQAQFWRHFLMFELGAILLGGVLLCAIFRASTPFPSSLRGGKRVGIGIIAVGLGVAASLVAAAWLFGRWDGSVKPEHAYPMPGVDELSFSSAQTLEVARQVQPFIAKNSERIRERTEKYMTTAATSLRAEVPAHAGALDPRPGERIVIAEADPQGSFIGTRVRATMYSLLREYLTEDALMMRTISGDVTSNGTVAEAGFVEGESNASGDVPLVVVKGDHDTDTTLEQLVENDVINPDFEVSRVDGLDVVAGNDPAFKALFGGLVVNKSGVTETELGENLRDELDAADRDDPLIVLFHQPRSATGYVGIDAMGDLDRAVGRETIPWDDGIPDLPPGIINIGHLHDAAPPKVIWNTDGDEVSWTVLNQLGTSGGVEETHVQPVVHPVLGSVEDRQRPAPVRGHQYRAPDRLRLNWHCYRRQGHHHGPERSWAGRRTDGRLASTFHLVGQ